MKQQFVPFGIVIGVFLLLIGGVAIASRHANSTNRGSQTTPSPLLTISDNKIATIATILDRTPTPSPVPGASELPGAIEIEASQSAIATRSAKKVRFILTNGKSFTIALWEDLAPKTVRKFLENAQKKIYKDNLFFRVEKDQQGQTMLVQTGDPSNTGQGGGTMQAEYNKKPFTPGSVGIARGQNRDKNNDSQFFITVGEVASLNENYTNFGDVIDGFDVVANIKQGQPILTVEVVQ